ncbi:hypothetical protein [Rickettsia felis]|uniref:hypothetical protein n=1 Tax=Rickettsia felis TaxID=42862 RepID=UPI001F215638|nr:hypothetical protein [Rickettsia felis]
MRIYGGARVLRFQYQVLVIYVLFSQIPLEVKQFCNKLAGRIKNGEAISLILDSTGLRFNTASNWYATKYNKVCKNKPWQKMHISIDPAMNIHNVIGNNNSSVFV